MRTSFSEEVAAARPRVTAVVRRIAGDDAEDVVQEAVLRAFLSISSLRDRTRFEAWLCGIALNVAKQRLRRAAAETRALVRAGPSHGAPPGSEGELLDAVRDAVQLLPPAQRDAVLLHYVDGLSCAEVAAIVGATPGAVRVRLHRARAQLRADLAAHAQTTPKEEAMVEMALADVLVRTGDDGAPPETVVVLCEQDGTRRLAIWVGAPEGVALGYPLLGDAPPRPLTSDLTAELLRAAGANVEEVAVTDLRDEVFYGTVTVDGTSVDARPSDALNLAARTGAPIRVAEHVLEAAATCEPPTEGWSSIAAETLRLYHRAPRKE